MNRGLVAFLVLCVSLLVSSVSVADSLGNGPKTIASHERVTVLIDREVVGPRSFIVLKISVPTDSTVNAFLLPNPPRIVVDFEGASIKKSENLKVPSNEVISQIRLGSHTGKIRFVIDLKKSTEPEYEWKAGKRQAILKIVEGAAPPAQPSTQPSIPEATREEAPKPTEVPAQQSPVPASPTVAPALTMTPTASPTLTVTPVPAETTAPTLSDVEKKAGAVTSLPPEESDKPAPKVETTYTINGYSFEYLPDKSPILKIALNKPKAQAQISKVDPETYSITIKDCNLANEDLELPQFPPHDFVGFVMVVSEQVGKDVEVSVSVEDSMVLATSVHDREIWVKKP